MIDVITLAPPTTDGVAGIAQQLAAHPANHRTIPSAAGWILPQFTTQARTPATLDLFEEGEEL